MKAPLGPPASAHLPLGLQLPVCPVHTSQQTTPRPPPPSPVPQRKPTKLLPSLKCQQEASISGPPPPGPHFVCKLGARALSLWSLLCRARLQGGGLVQKQGQVSSLEASNPQLATQARRPGNTLPHGHELWSRGDGLSLEVVPLFCTLPLLHLPLEALAPSLCAPWVEAQ